ncbi:34966_t:CDS:2 [Gigaspora margarita]|uniref:34966_t:CDS:1 n=1 Tax=Gigaspora margarita TaxID=4874 RepID=A0ABN7UYM3_GIGMA|nr:34966_t:CDS:2 [Gigaspora margarita]
MIESGGSLVDKSLVSESQALALKRSLNNNDTTETMKVKRVTLTKAQKAEICQLRKSGFTQLELANKFKIGESTVLKILKQQQNYWLSIDPNSKEAKSKRDRSAKHPQLEEILNLWISKAEAHHQTITGTIIQRKAFQLAEQLHIRLYWHLEPEKTLASCPVQGKKKKKAKDRVTILITCNCTGDDKLPPLLIYKYQNPRAIRRIDNEQMRRAGRKILLLMDKASPHTLEEGFVPSNVKIHYFPSYNTAHLQPCDAETMESGEDAPEINIKDAIDTIRSCWIKTEILPSNYFSLISWELEDYELIDLTLPRPQLEANPNPTDLVTEIQSLISQFPITNLMQANDFINVDNGVGTDIMPSDAEIINAIITNINNILRFISQENEFNVDGSFIQKLNGFKKDIVKNNFSLSKSFIPVLPPEAEKPTESYQLVDTKKMHYFGILQNTNGSSLYDEFVMSLGWEIELATYPGYLGYLRGLERNTTNGLTSIYYCTSTLEIIFMM